MCKIYNSIGSLKEIKSRLAAYDVSDFKSVKDLIDFKNCYVTERRRIISEHERLLRDEREQLEQDLKKLENEIQETKINSEQKIKSVIEGLEGQMSKFSGAGPSGVITRILNKFQARIYRYKINQKEKHFVRDVEYSTAELREVYRMKNERHQFLRLEFDDAVQQSSHVELSQFDFKHRLVEDLNNLIYGALGEQKVVKTLEALSDDYYLINDFALSFYPAIYNKKENDYIKSIQIDHILVAPSGIFLIETKNWSDQSLENQNLRSPVEQIRRSSFAIFKLLNNPMSNFNVGLKGHHWGEKKIPIRNLIVLTNTKPREEFQYVKVVTMNELLRYINYFEPIFTNIETQRVADYLVTLNNQHTVST